MLHTKKPREQVGRDTISRFKAQIRSAAMASLSILEGQEIDRVYCDLHDDFVIRKTTSSGINYIFYQVKTNNKNNHNWTLNEIFGLHSRKKAEKQDTDKIKNSFAGKLLLHTVVFDVYCNSVVFQTNIHNHDSVENLVKDIAEGKFENKFTKVLVDRFEECFPDDNAGSLTIEKIKEKLSKLKFETDVQHLKNVDDSFEAIAKNKIYKFSEVELDHVESREILLKLLDLVSRKSSGVINLLSHDSIEELAGISIDDLLPMLSISKDAYDNLLAGGDPHAIKNASIIQRTLSAAGAETEQIEYCSRCKSKWDLWLRHNRHLISEFDLQSITSEIRLLLDSSINSKNSIHIAKLKGPISALYDKFKLENLIYDLDKELILGGVFAELVKGKS